MPDWNSKHNKLFAAKPLSEKKRYEFYGETYLRLRKFKLCDSWAKHCVEQIIIANNKKWDLNDTINNVNINWYRCRVCNKVLKIDKRSKDRYCTSKSCEMYHISVKDKQNG